MTATEDLVKAQIQATEERWKERFDKETNHAKAELVKMKEDLESIRASQSHAGAWKDKSQVEQYKEKFALRKKEANYEKPTVKLNDENFTEFKQQVTGWMKALHPLIKKVMESLEKPENRALDEEDIKKRLLEAMRQQAEEKYKIYI